MSKPVLNFTLLFLLISGVLIVRKTIQSPTSVSTPAPSSAPIHYFATPTPIFTLPTPSDLSLVSPLPRSNERVTNKPFGLYITPETSPVQPDRFTGFHTGTDFEVFPDELNVVVLVRTICSGPLEVIRYASGYGGVAVQSCRLEDQPVTVVYGHLDLQSIPYIPGDLLPAGTVLGQLGADLSPETDGARKHLHLSLHRGSANDIRGYVPQESELSAWLDPCQYLCH